MINHEDMPNDREYVSLSIIKIQIEIINLLFH